jgi:hypothetical protein
VHAAPDQAAEPAYRDEAPSARDGAPARDEEPASRDAAPQNDDRARDSARGAIARERNDHAHRHFLRRRDRTNEASEADAADAEGRAPR